MALRCVEEQAAKLAEQTVAACVSAGLKPSAPVLLHGGLFENCPMFRSAFERSVRERLPNAPIQTPSIRGHEAVARLALMQPPPEGITVYEGDGERAIPPTEGALASRGLEEGRLKEARSLDRMTAEEIVQAMCREDAVAAEAAARQAPSIAAAVDLAAKAIASGGRIVYVGAGTSGRLGVLDASECPPTFGVAPERVIGLIAGGAEALRVSVEGAEDDAGQAVKDLRALAPPLTEKDVVIGVSASGTTPYVRAALDEGERLHAQTVLVCCDPSRRDGASLVIAMDTGPEVLPGSTRLKAGTATKMVLNQISTGAMALSGYVYEGLMTGVQPSNTKLRRRAEDIVSALTGLAGAAAGELLASAGDRVAVAVVMARLDTGVGAAEKRLQSVGGSLRAALEGE